MSTDTQPIIDVALAAAGPKPLAEDVRFHTVVSPADGGIKIIDLQAECDKIRDTPRRKTGTYKVHDPASLVAYLEKHGDPDSEVWADTVNAKITAVLNAHTGDRDDQQTAGRFEDHRVEYAVLLTEAWKAWKKYDGQLVDQATFAELIEERAIDIVSPTAADMLELAQSFRATTGVEFKSSKRLGNGERQFEYREQVEAGAGKDGQMEIPETFELGLQPFEGADRFKVTARFRYRINNGALAVGFKLERPEDVLREAFLTVVAKVQDGIADLGLIESPIFLGSS